MQQDGRMQAASATTPETTGLSPRGEAASLRHERREFVSMMTRKVRDAHILKPVIVDGTTDLVTLCSELSRRRVNDALVRDGDRLGIFTTTDLRDALASGKPPADRQVREIAHFKPYAVEADDELFDALILMQRHRIHRVVVKEGGEVIGLLHQMDLMAFVAGHSQLIALQASNAPDIAALGAAARQTDGLIRDLYGDGVRIEVIAGLVGGLNRQVFHRLWELLAPAELRENSCLIVMGSEGRNEQIFKTDQDNALILRDGFQMEGLDQITAAFTAALLEFGYPLCKGGVMLNRPQWCQPVAQFKETITDWIYGSNPDGPMNLAIFLDASAVTGDVDLLAEARDHVDRVLSGSDAYFARFAAAVDQFTADEGGWWRRLPGLRGREAAEADLKKLGIFPLVHGVRTLALQYGLREIGTVDRMRGLVEAGKLDATMARDLTDALRFLMALKLSNNMRQVEEGREADNTIRLSDLGTLKRQSLRDSLGIVRDFRRWLGVHYRLDSL